MGNTLMQHNWVAFCVNIVSVSSRSQDVDDVSSIDGAVKSAPHKHGWKRKITKKMKLKIKNTKTTDTNAHMCYYYYMESYRNIQNRIQRVSYKLIINGDVPWNLFQSHIHTCNW